MIKTLKIISLLLIIPVAMQAQAGYWQQRVKYIMDVDMDIERNTFSATQKVEYINNSPDILRKVFFHLYLNAFQPGSSMDVRSRELGKNIIGGKQDWDARIKDTMQRLKPEEVGYQKIDFVKVNGIAQKIIYHGTILEVVLSKPILPKAKVVFDMQYTAQVPLQIRRTGRDNPRTGVRYSMAQWYPKMCEYDKDGWHPTPYVAREFYGVWGDFDVTINIDRQYKLGATGVLSNAAEVGWGYDKEGTVLKPISGPKRKWHFVANNVHDFVWAADPDYKHFSKKMPTGTILHLIYKEKPGDMRYDSAWRNILPVAEKVFPFIEKTFGKYPFPQYSFIQGGDGGMEYPMATLIAGNSPGLIFHEWLHSWYQMILGTNESLYPWMDEGFASYAEDHVNEFFTGKTSLAIIKEGLERRPNPTTSALLESLPEGHADAYLGYYNLLKSGLEEPLTTHADHYNTNFAYSNSSYSKGQIFVEQLGYIVGAPIRDKILLEYYNKWKFKHPTPDDFLKVAEDVSDIKLDWYKEYWIYTTKKINYAIDSLWEDAGKTNIRLRRIGLMPMPIDVELSYKDGSSEMFSIPMNLMYGAKANENPGQKFIVLPSWDWANPYYTLQVTGKLFNMLKVEIDPSKRMADIDRKNNLLELKW